MARKIKIDNAELKQLQRSSKSRKLNTRPERRYFLIVCEGEKTEPNYFLALKRSLPIGVLEVCDFKIEGTGYNTESLLKVATQLKAKWEHKIRRKVEKIWIVFDRDSFSTRAFNATIAKCLAQAPNINAAWTNEAFELWYLLHFDTHISAIGRDQYKEKIEQAFKSRGLVEFEYKKNREDMFMLLARYGNLDLAISRAKDLVKTYHAQNNYANHNPCTMVFTIIEEFREISKQLIPDENKPNLL